MTSDRTRSFTVAFVVLLAGGILLLRPAVPAGPPADKGAPDATAIKETEGIRPGDRSRQLRRQMKQYLDVPAIKANTPLSEAIDLLSNRYNVRIEIDSEAFDAIEVQKVENFPVQLPRMSGVRLGTVLKRLMRQIKSNRYHGAYILKPDHIELTSEYQQWVEAGADPISPNLGLDADDEPIVERTLGYFGKYRRMTAVVHFDFEQQPFNQAMRELADDTGYDVLIDPRAAEKARVPVTLALNNVWLDNAVSLLTETAELDWYWRDRVIYVTTKEQARQRRALKAAD